MNFQRLIAEHDQIDALTSELEAVSLSRVPNPYAVAEAQFALRQALDDHFNDEEETLYARLLGAGGSSMETLVSFQAELHILCADWNEYLAEWNLECLNADWVTFRHETKELMERVRKRTSEETKLIYAQALKSGLITLRGDTAEA